MVIAFLLSLLSLTIGVSGYYLIAGFTLIDAFYMTVITLSTVGFKEVHALSDAGKIFTAIYIILNLVIFAYVLTVIATYLFEGELRQFLRSYMSERELKKLKDHVIVCGYGRNGRTACEELARDKKKFVIIENRETSLEDVPEDLALVKGDATAEETLIQAGIERAYAIITTLPKDADNVFITLTARVLNPSVKIISRATDTKAERKLLIAGATHVIMPDYIGGIQMAHLITKPYVIEFLETLSGLGADRLHLEEFRYQDFRNEYRDKSLSDLNIRRETGALVLGFKRSDQGLLFNPKPDVVISENDVMIILGDDDNLDKFRKTYL